MVETRPGHVGNVKKSVNSIEVDEGPEVRDVLDRSDDLVADIDSAEEGLALLGALLLDDLAAAEDHVFPVLVDFDNFKIVDVPDELLEVLRGDDVDLGGGKKRFDADVDGEPAFDDRADFSLDETVAFEDADDLFPVLALGGFFFRENDHSLVVFETFEEDFDLVTDFDVVRIFELGSGNDSLAFVSDVHEELP